MPSHFVSYQKTLKDFAKLKLKFHSIFFKFWSLAKRGLFEHKLTLDFILLTFVDAKWTKSMPTFVKSFNKSWPVKFKRFFELNLSVLAKFCTVSFRY
jgi:hypothetical protein